MDILNSNIDEYECYSSLYGHDFKPINFININTLFIVDKIYKNLSAIIYKEYQDAFITIIKEAHFDNGKLIDIFERDISHTPELLKKLTTENEECEKIKRMFIDKLRNRGHKRIKIETEYQDCSWQDNSYKLITTIDSEFHISINNTFKEGRALVIEEGKFFKKYNPEIWGCFSYEKDTVSKNFRFLFDETKKEFVK